MADKKKKAAKAPHEGHRKRMRERYDKEGFDSFAEHEILEYLLFYAIRRANTNLTAHNLIDAFGSLYNVLTAPRDKLLEVSGVGSACADLLITSFDSARNAIIRKVTEKPLLTYGQIHQIAVEWFADKPYGYGAAILMDASRKFLDILPVTTDTSELADTPAEGILPQAHTLNARYVVYLHNHNEGQLFPSNSDILATRNLYYDLKAEEITLLEHLIVVGFDTLPILDRSMNEKLTGFPFAAE